MYSFNSPKRLPTAPASPSSADQRLNVRRPLIVFFIVAFAGSWICEIPLALSRAGLGLLPFTPSLTQLDIVVVLAAFTGPTLAAFTVTNALEGKAGMARLLKRFVQWRAGIRWYLLALFGMPLIAVLVACAFLGAAPLNSLIHQWTLVFTLYLPYALTIGLNQGGPLAEEPGWRCFALPRLQQRYGALGGSLILGVLWGLWRLPLLLIPALDGNLDSRANIIAFLGFMVAIIAFAVIMTWVYNNTTGSLLIGMLLHSARNATVLLERQIFPAFLHLPQRYWALALAFVACALLILIFTRGTLTYNPTAPERPAQPKASPEMPEKS